MSAIEKHLYVAVNSMKRALISTGYIRSYQPRKAKVLWLQGTEGCFIYKKRRVREKKAKKEPSFAGCSSIEEQKNKNKKKEHFCFASQGASLQLLN